MIRKIEAMPTWKACFVVVPIALVFATVVTLATFFWPIQSQASRYDHQIKQVQQQGYDVISIYDDDVARVIEDCRLVTYQTVGGRVLPFTRTPAPQGEYAAFGPALERRGCLM